MNYLPSSSPRLCAGFAALALLGFPIAESQGATFTWTGTAGNLNWSSGSNWGGTAPAGTNPADVLVFGGDVATPYTANNDVANPFLLDQFVFNVTDPGALGTTHFIAGNTLRFASAAPQIVANGAGGMRIDAPIELLSNLTLTGNGTGVITLNNTLSGTVDIVKNGTSTFRFGSQTIPGIPPTELPSDNTWYGRLTINDGTIRFNNNATSGRTALRGNPVTLTNVNAKLTVGSELRVGTLSGSAGTVESLVTGTDSDNDDLVIHMIPDGTFAGTLRLGPPTGSGDDNGELIFRGPGTQTLTGTLDIRRDVLVGRGATAVFGGTASLSAQANGAIVMNGGTLKLDNSTTNSNNRLRDATAIQTGLDTVGGGSFVLIGNAAGTQESVGRLQLGSMNNVRSGHLNASVVHDAGSTILNFAAYTRDSTNLSHYATIDFSAANTAGAVRTLGATGVGSRITFSGFAVLQNNGLIANSNVGSTDTGWATVNGTDFATYDNSFDSGFERGVRAAATAAFPGGTGNSATNALLMATNTISSATDFSLNSLKIQPTGSGLTLSISAAGNLNNRSFLLAGANDFTIQNSGSGTGGISGGGTRYFHVQQAMLNVDVSLASGTGASSAIVKAGSGFLNFLKNSSAVTAPLVINSGTVRSSLADLPQGELQFRGGVYEISGGGTFARPITFGANGVTWSGIDLSFEAIDQDRGSGGFSAFGGNVTIDLGLAGPTDLTWEDKGFLNSGHALLFGSTRADSLVTWSDNLALSATQTAVNYNLREIRVLDNPALLSDYARISGAISGLVQDDLLKTGPGTLELTGANSYQGATQIHEGTLRVNSTIASSFLTIARNGGILAGNGTTGAVRLEIGGVVAPGDAEGDTSVIHTGELRVVGTGARVAVEIGGILPGGDSTNGYDQLDVSGAVVLNGAELAGLLISAFVPQAGNLFFIISNDGTDAVQGQFLQGTSVTIGGFPFDIGYTGNWTGNQGTSTFLGGNDVVLRGVPEPGTAMLVAAGLCTLALRRRRVTGLSQNEV